MKRRDVVKLGAVAAGVGVGVPGCALPRMLGSLSGDDGAVAFNAMLDEQLEVLGRPGLLQRMVEKEVKRPLSPEASAKIGEQDALFRQMLGALLISQGFRELPVETQVHASVQERMWRHMDDISMTVFDVSDMLAALDDSQRATVKAKLKQQPDLPMAIGEALDGRAAKAGMSLKRRTQLRMMMSQSQFRLQHGDPGSIIDEYVDKVERMRAASERDGQALDLAKELGEREFWRYQHLFASDPGQGPVTAQAAPAPAPGSPAPPVPAPPSGPPGAAPPAAPNQMAAVLTESARSAARLGHCQTVAFYSERVRALDPAYHQATFQSEPLLVDCRVRDLTAASAPPVPAEKKRRPGEGGMRAAGYMLGIGLIFGAVGALLLAAEAFVGVIGLTIAVILFGVGLIVLLISAIVYAASGPD